MSLRATSSALLFASAIAAGCVGHRAVVDDDAQTARASSPITDGTLDEGDESVVAILADGHLCTGTMVSPWVVLTAAHCVAPPATIEVLFGRDIHAPELRRRVTGAIRHPSFDAATYANDIAVLLLDDRAPDSALPLVPMARTLPPALSSVRIVGFGLDGDSVGLKRQGVAHVTTVGDDTFRLVRGPSQTCRGDSGGPAFATVDGVEVLVGVTSVGDDSCVAYGDDTRVDRYLDTFVSPWIARAEAMSASGERCYRVDGCATGVCVFPADAPSVGYCAPECGAGPPCPAPMACSAGECRLPTPSPGAIGSACDVDADCEVQSCARRAGDVRGTCAEACYLNAIPCAGDFDCAQTTRTDSYACFPRLPQPTARGGGCAIERRGGRASMALLSLLAVMLVVRGRRR